MSPDLGKVEPGAHVVEAGQVLHAAVGGQAGQVGPQGPPGEIQPQHRLQDLGPLADRHKAWGR